MLYNRYIRLFTQLLTVLLLFTISRGVFYLFNKESFSLDAIELLYIFFTGVRFDASAIVFVNSLYIVLFTLPFSFTQHSIYAKFLHWIFYITNSIALLLNSIDMVFFQFIFRRTTWDVIKGSIIGDDMQSLLLQYIIDFWYIALIWILLVAVLVILFRKTQIKIKPDQHKLSAIWANILGFIICIAASVVVFRGGFQLRPISIVTAGEYTQPDNTPLLINTPFAIITTFHMNSIAEKKYFSSQESKKIFNPIITPRSVNLSNGNIKKFNIVILIVESLSEEYIGKLNKNISSPFKSYTPFIDSLIEHSYYFTNGYANAKRSIEGIPAIVSSIPSLMDDAYLTSVFSANKINSLPILLKKYGYTSAFFHGGKNGTMNFDAFASAAGFEKYYGKNEYPNDTDYDGDWGIYDEEFLQFSAQTMNTFHKPFVSVVFTLSSHHPYAVPEKHKNKFDKGTLEIHESIGYADYSLKQFFRTFTNLSCFDSTIFVITADHTSLAASPVYKSSVGVYAIPILYFFPAGGISGVQQKITQQIDIMPSILDIINYPEPFTCFGRSVFDTTSPRFAITYFNNTYQLIMDDYVLLYANDKSQGVFNFKQDQLLKTNVLIQAPDQSKKMEKFMKGYIQNYNSRMIRNKLTDINDIP